MDLGGVSSLGMFRVCRFCVSASPRGSPGTDRTVRPLTGTQDLLQGRSWDRTLVHTVILAGFLLVLVDFSLGWPVPQW